VLGVGDPATYELIEDEVRSYLETIVFEQRFHVDDIATVESQRAAGWWHVTAVTSGSMSHVCYVQLETVSGSVDCVVSSS